ncbi:MAG: hypothetical protein JNM49_03165 [Flavobacteriales bacterium]|nr:hypothetical protein [Flavobacteriales bacterium]
MKHVTHPFMFKDRRTIILHIGWPKTGTTTLQKHVLNKLTGFRYLGKTPFVGGKNKLTFDLVYFLAYASHERAEIGAMELYSALTKLEVELFGNVETSVPVVLSEEGVLSSLLKPSDHQHHGFSTASLEQIISWLLQLEKAWNASFHILVTERDPVEVLHAYYAQMFHVFRRLRGLDTFKGYVDTGVKDSLGRDLGFRYLRPDAVNRVLQQRLGAGKVFTIAMDMLFTPGWAHLSRWYPAFPDLEIGNIAVENKRSVSKDVKTTHLRPIWMEKERFRLRPFLRTVRDIYKERYADHKDLEVPVVLEGSERSKLQEYLRADRAPGDGK